MKLSNEKILTIESKMELNKNIEMVPPDGGWGWMIVFSSIIISIFGSLPQLAFSILFSPLLMTSGVSSTKIAWIFNTYTLTYSINAIFVGPLCEELGYRKVAFIGGMISFVSITLSSFPPSIDFLFFSFAILGGIGGSSSLITSFLIVPKYFEKRRGFAIGITAFGSSLSSFLAPIASNYLLENFDYKGASLIFAAIVLNQCVGAMLYQPVEWHMKPVKDNHVLGILLKEESKDKYQQSEVETNISEETIQINPFKNANEKNTISSHSNVEDLRLVIPENASETYTKDIINLDSNTLKESRRIVMRVTKSTYRNLKSLKCMRVQFIALAYSTLIVGYANFLMWIPFVIIDVGYSLESAAWCSSSASIGNISGRLMCSMIVDRKFFNIRYGYMFGMFLMGFCMTLISYGESISFYLISAYIWGLGAGIASVILVPVMIQVMGTEMLPAVLGVSQLLQGFIGVAIGTITGSVKDVSKDYTYTLWILAGCVFFSLFLWLMMPCAETFDSESKRKENIELN